MGIQDLQIFLNNKYVGGSEPVDLIRMANTFRMDQYYRVGKSRELYSGKLRLVLDGECCLDRLYGGSYSSIYTFSLVCYFFNKYKIEKAIYTLDWVCGGQWNRMLEFLAALIQATEPPGMELAVFFNGCFESPRLTDWIQNQLQVRIKVNNVS